MSSNPNDPHPTYSSYQQPPYSSYEQQPGASSFNAGDPFGGAQSAPQNAMMTEADYRQLGQEPPLSQPLYGAKPITAYIRFWKKYVRFKGYASRSEYWWPYLINTLITFGLYILAAIIGTATANTSTQSTYSSYNSDPGMSGGVVFVFILIFLFWLSILLPSVSLGWRRIQDVGMHGALIFLNLIPYIGAFITLIFCILPSKPGLRNPGYDDNTGD